MEQPKVIVISGNEPGLSNLQKMVGGSIERQIGQYDGKECDLIFDEEGKYKDKPLNLKATELWIGTDVRYWHDVLVGDVVVLTGKARMT